MKPTLPPLPEPAAFMNRPGAKNSYNRREPYFDAAQVKAYATAYGERCARAAVEEHKTARAERVHAEFVPMLDAVTRGELLNDIEWCRVNDEIGNRTKAVLDEVLPIIRAATPPAVEARVPDERAKFEEFYPPLDMVYWEDGSYHVKDAYINSYRADRFVGQWKAWQTRAMLSAAPAAPQAEKVVGDDHSPCKGTNCGITRKDQEHSAECHADHEVACAVDPLETPGNRHPEYRYAGYKGHQLTPGCTGDQFAAYQEGQRARLPATQPPTQQASEQPSEPEQAKWKPLPYETPFDIFKAFHAGTKFVLHYHGKTHPVERMQPMNKVVFVQPPNMAVKVFPNGKNCESAGDAIWLEQLAAPQQASAQGEQAQQASAQPTQAAMEIPHMNVSRAEFEYMRNPHAQTVQSENCGSTLPCPFCGSSDISDGEMLTEESDGTTYTQSECKGCGAIGPKGFLNRDVADYGCVKAIAAWNRRASNTGQGD